MVRWRLIGKTDRRYHIPKQRQVTNRAGYDAALPRRHSNPIRCGPLLVDETDRQ
jgi:hypothetical protein